MYRAHVALEDSGIRLTAENTVAKLADGKPNEYAVDDLFDKVPDVAGSDYFRI